MVLSSTQEQTVRNQTRQDATTASPAPERRSAKMRFALNSRPGEARVPSRDFGHDWRKGFADGSIGRSRDEACVSGQRICTASTGSEMEMANASAITDHYARAGLGEVILEALRLQARISINSRPTTSRLSMSTIRAAVVQPLILPDWPPLRLKTGCWTWAAGSEGPRDTW